MIEVMDVNVKMPIVVNQRRQADYAQNNSDFVRFSSSALGLEVIKRGQEQIYRLTARPTQISPYELEFMSSFPKFEVLGNSFEIIELDTDFKNQVLLEAVTVSESSELEDSAFYGVQIVDHSPKVIFSQKVELELNKLERWRPQITIDSFLLEDDE